MELATQHMSISEGKCHHGRVVRKGVCFLLVCLKHFAVCDVFIMEKTLKGVGEEEWIENKEAVTTKG